MFCDLAWIGYIFVFNLKVGQHLFFIVSCKFIYQLPSAFSIRFGQFYLLLIMFSFFHSDQMIKLINFLFCLQINSLLLFSIMAFPQHSLKNNMALDRKTCSPLVSLLSLQKSQLFYYGVIRIFKVLQRMRHKLNQGCLVLPYQLFEGITNHLQCFLILLKISENGQA